MSMPADANSSAARTLADRIGVLCEEFEQSWQTGSEPRIERYLQQVCEEQRSTLLVELLSRELDLLGESRYEADLGEYLSRFPESKQLVSDVFARQVGDTKDVTLVSLTGFLGRERGDFRSTSGPLVDLEQLTSERRYDKGEYLMRQGTEATSLMVIRAGSVDIYVDDNVGRTHVIGHLGSGQVIGEMALLTSEPRTASVVAVEPVRVSILPAEAFHQLIQRHPGLSAVLTDLIAERLGNAQRDALTDKRFDRYCVRRRLGRGGMAVVYEAVDTTNDSQVALKMMSHRLVNSPVALQRFQQEADLIERFDSPHIVKMYHRFAAFRTYFIAMEYCQGTTLSRHLAKEGPMDEAAFRRALGQLAKALDHAHGQGVVHRDIKPANIMRLRDGTFKVMDFGLAEPIAASPASQVEVVGTPRYMAPEQRVGAQFDQRADFFSLGCVAYEMLIGEPLFAHSGYHELSRDFTRWQPPDFACLAQPLSEETARFVQPLLAVDPNDRTVDLSTIATWDD